MPREYHIAVTGCDNAEGTQSQPFRTISRAAAVAETGDKVIVHEGEYREWVKPAHSGYSNLSRIIYEAAPGERVVIKGSEQVAGWVEVRADVWKAVLPNSMFGDYNPYMQPVEGDWLIENPDGACHTGDVYLNGKSFYEAKSLEEVFYPEPRTGFVFPGQDRFEAVLEPEWSVHRWYAQVEADTTTLYANFQGADPNRELVEINVRKCCFYPEKTGMNYITVRGFEMAQAACPWTPPTADQPGLIGTNWSKGWIIEDNHIHDAKCSAVSIGKEASTGHNLCSRRYQKPGYQYQMEAVFRALQIGWSKETIGSHIIRNNVIHDCGQNGIVGHMGGVFSRIYGNHIYNIGVKHEFFGYELGGIKLHAAIDVQITQNRIHNCTLGIWLDWQAQGTRVSRNLFYRNDRDLMIEVTHGPCLVDSNILASPFALDNFAQGTAYVHNLCCGRQSVTTVLDRSTPYHFPHTTQVAGSTVVYGGDHRFYNNLFVGGGNIPDCGTAMFNHHTASYQEYIDGVIAYEKESGDRDLVAFQHNEQPVYIDANAYLCGAEGYHREKTHYDSPFDPGILVIEEGDSVYLELYIEDAMLALPTEVISTEKLGTVRIVDAVYDDPNGEAIRLDMDYSGTPRREQPCVGPLEGLAAGHNRIRVW